MHPSSYLFIAVLVLIVLVLFIVIRHHFKRKAVAKAEEAAAKAAEAQSPLPPGFYREPISPPGGPIVPRSTFDDPASVKSTAWPTPYDRDGGDDGASLAAGVGAVLLYEGLTHRHDNDSNVVPETVTPTPLVADTDGVVPDVPADNVQDSPDNFDQTDPLADAVVPDDSSDGAAVDFGDDSDDDDDSANDAAVDFGGGDSNDND